MPEKASAPEICITDEMVRAGVESLELAGFGSGDSQSLLHQTVREVLVAALRSSQSRTGLVIQ